MHAQQLEIELVGIAMDLRREGMPLSITLGISQQWTFVPISVKGLCLECVLQISSLGNPGTRLSSQLVSLPDASAMQIPFVLSALDCDRLVQTAERFHAD